VRSPPEDFERGWASHVFRARVPSSFLVTLAFGEQTAFLELEISYIYV